MKYVPNILQTLTPLMDVFLTLLTAFPITRSATPQIIPPKLITAPTSNIQLTISKRTTALCSLEPYLHPLSEHTSISTKMPPKNKGKAAGKSKDTSDDADSGKKGSGAGKLKPATAINVRHILCETHSKKEEAMEKLRNGAKFDEVAREMSEDKARQGTYYFERSK
jgi:parvulin-like peptidyl-prolyl isomerase